MRTRELRGVGGRLREPAQRGWVAIIQPPNRTAPIGAAHTGAGVDTLIGRQATSMEAALGRKATKASGIPLRKAIQGVNRTLVEIRARRVLTRRHRAVALAVTGAGGAASVVAAEATASVAVAATASVVVAAIAPAADTEGSAVSAAH